MWHSLPPVDGATHQFVTANGLRFHVAEAGRGDPVLLLHGWPQHWYMWRYQIPVLARHYAVTCLDLRGLGWSDAPARGYEKERLVDDVIAVLDALRLDRIRLIGHDWGGWVGFLLSLREPRRVQRFLALNIPHPFQRVDSRILLLWRFWYQWVIASPLLGKWILQHRPGFVRQLLQWGVVHKRWTKQEIFTYTSRLQEPARAAASVQLYRSLLLREFVPIIAGRYRAKRLRPPTLLLFGTRDNLLAPGMLQGFEPYADDLTVELVPDCGHFIAEDQPELVTQRALEFLAG